MNAVDLKPFAELYPFSPNYLPVDGGNLHYLDEGSPAARPLLLLHGNPTWSFYYREVIRALRSDHRVIAPDHLGCGLSDKPQEYEYRLERRIEHVEQLVQKLGLKDLTLVLHDWGGAIGMGFATRHPELVRDFVILNTAAFPSPRIPFSIDVCRVPGFGALMIRGFNAFSRAALIRAVHHKDRLTAQVRAGYLAPYKDWDTRVAQLRFVQDIPMSRQHPSRRCLEEIDRGLAGLREKPMQIFWGARDFCFDLEFLEQWRRRFPAASVEVFDDASHYVLEDAHERIVPKMRSFLEAGA